MNLILFFLGSIFSYLILFLLTRNNKRTTPFWVAGDFGGDKPEAPTYEIPAWAQGLPQETLGLIRQGIGQQVATPQEYGVASSTLQDLLKFQPQQLTEPTEYGDVSSKLQQLYGYQPEQFQLPISDIQQALQAQQALQLENYQKQIRPVLAQQGQLDSSYYTNLLGDYLKGQQAQTYGTTADLLTQQALQNAQIQQWLPQYQAGIAQQLQSLGGARSGIEQYNVGTQNAIPQFQASLAQQLAGLGSQRAALDQFNLTLPYQTVIPALQQQYGTGLNQAGQEYNAALVPYQQQLNEYNQKQQQQADLYKTLGSAAAAAATGGASGAAGLYGSGVGGGQGALLGLTGFSPGFGSTYRAKWKGAPTGYQSPSISAPVGYRGGVTVPGYGSY
jgi:hypothetical protein